MMSISTISKCEASLLLHSNRTQWCDIFRVRFKIRVDPSMCFATEALVFWTTTDEYFNHRITTNRQITNLAGLNPAINSRALELTISIERLFVYLTHKLTFWKGGPESRFCRFHEENALRIGIRNSSLQIIALHNLCSFASIYSSLQIKRRGGLSQTNLKSAETLHFALWHLQPLQDFTHLHGGGTVQCHCSRSQRDWDELYMPPKKRPGYLKNEPRLTTK